MKFPDALNHLPTDRTVRRVYGEPYQTANGATVIPVARIMEGRGKRRPAQNADAEQAYGFAGAPLGVFIIHGDRASWVPAVDGNRIALLGVFAGLLAAVIGSLAVLRRPPWPQITITRELGNADHG